jgi:hypothetical protein
MRQALRGASRNCLHTASAGARTHRWPALGCLGGRGCCVCCWWACRCCASRGQCSASDATTGNPTQPHADKPESGAVSCARQNGAPACQSGRGERGESRVHAGESSMVPYWAREADPSPECARCLLQTGHVDGHAGAAHGSGLLEIGDWGRTVGHCSQLFEKAGQ